MISEQLKKTLVEKIKKVCSPVKIVLFGSFAYGQPGTESDLDIAIITKNDSTKFSESTLIWKSLKEIPYPKDIIVASAEEYEFYSKEAGSVFKTIHDKGLVLYAA